MAADLIAVKPLSLLVDPKSLFLVDFLGCFWPSFRADKLALQVESFDFSSPLGCVLKGKLFSNSFQNGFKVIQL